MTEGPRPAPTAALAAWLAAPSDRQRLLALVSAAAVAPISGATIDRFSVDVLTALHQAEGVCFDGLRPALRAAALVTGFGPRLGLTPTAEERRDMEQLPFVVHVVDRDVVIEVCASVERRHGIGQPFYHQWAAGISAAAVVIDCHRVEHVNSVLIAWMLQLVQSAKPVPVQVRRARIQVMTQLRQLRLDHLMSIA
jgi:hypothetical protein